MKKFSLYLSIIVSFAFILGTVVSINTPTYAQYLNPCMCMWVNLPEEGQECQVSYRGTCPNDQICSNSPCQGKESAYQCGNVNAFPCSESPTVNFQNIIQKAFPNYSPGAINITDPNLTIGAIISGFLPYIFALAGLLLFGLLIWGGFELMTSAGDPKKIESAKGRLTGAVIGFVIIFVAYWLVQIMEVIFNLKIF